MPPPTGKVAIIGAGEVGATIAYALLLRSIATDIFLIDTNTEKCRAQVQDLSDGAFLSSARIHQGTWEDARQCDIVVVTAGAKQQPGEPRLELTKRNLQILKSIISAIKPFRENAILLMVTNPVDVMTQFAQRLSGLPKCQVFGSGTLLDSARLRHSLMKKINVSCRPWEIYRSEEPKTFSSL
jgi:L-lactate dehydrogenase